MVCFPIVCTICAIQCRGETQTDSTHTGVLTLVQFDDSFNFTRVWRDSLSENSLLVYRPYAAPICFNDNRNKKRVKKSNMEDSLHTHTHTNKWLVRAGLMQLLVNWEYKWNISQEVNVSPWNIFTKNTIETNGADWSTNYDEGWCFWGLKIKVGVLELLHSMFENTCVMSVYLVFASLCVRTPLMHMEINIERWLKRYLTLQSQHTLRLYVYC